MSRKRVRDEDVPLASASLAAALVMSKPAASAHEEKQLKRLFRAVRHDDVASILSYTGDINASKGCWTVLRAALFISIRRLAAASASRRVYTPSIDCALLQALADRGDVNPNVYTRWTAPNGRVAHMYVAVTLVHNAAEFNNVTDRAQALHDMYIPHVKEVLRLFPSMNLNALFAGPVTVGKRYNKQCDSSRLDAYMSIPSRRGDLRCRQHLLCWLVYYRIFCARLDSYEYVKAVNAVATVLMQHGADMNMPAVEDDGWQRPYTAREYAMHMCPGFVPAFSRQYVDGNGTLTLRTTFLNVHGYVSMANADVSIGPADSASLQTVKWFLKTMASMQRGSSTLLVEHVFVVSTFLE